MATLLIEPKSLNKIRNHPEEFSNNTIDLFKSTTGGAEALDNNYIIAVDLATKDKSDYSCYAIIKYKNGVFKNIGIEWVK